MKQKFVDAHMKAAEIYANLSSARRLKVGCVIVKQDTIIGIGYNGMPSGWDNNCENVEFVVADETPVDHTEMVRRGYTRSENGNWFKLHTKDEVIHAESNALSKIARSTNSSEFSDMFITHAPCLQCAKLIFQSGIRKVFYREEYRDDGGIEFLKKCGVEIEKV